MPDHASFTGSPAVPTPHEAAESLAQAQLAMQRTRRDVAGSSLWPHSITDGIVWLGGFTATQFLSAGLAMIAWIVVGFGTGAVHHILEQKQDHLVESGWGCKAQRIWISFFAGMLCLDLIINSSHPYVVALVNGALWGIAIMVYAILVDDRAHLVLGGSILLLAVVLHTVIPHWSPLLFGLIGGGGMLLEGLAQMWQVRRQW